VKLLEVKFNKEKPAAATKTVDSKKKQTAAAVAEEKSEEEEEEEGVTIEKKMEFVDKVKKLTNEGLTKMVEHIQTLLPQSISDLENDRL
jgi:hypothetical protein